MEGWKLLVVRQLDAENHEAGGYVVAADAVGAASARSCSTPPAAPRARRR